MVFFVMVVNEDYKSHLCFVFLVLGDVDLWRDDHRMEADRRFIPNLIKQEVIYCRTGSLLLVYMPPCNMQALWL